MTRSSMKKFGRKSHSYRVTLDLTDAENRALESIARASGIAQSQVLRDALWMLHNYCEVTSKGAEIFEQRPGSEGYYAKHVAGYHGLKISN